MKRAEYLAANTISRDKPWEVEGISERTWWYRKAEKEAATSATSANCLTSNTGNCRSVQSKNQSKKRHLSIDVVTVHQRGKNIEINLRHNPQKWVIIIGKTKKGTIITAKQKRKNCKDYDIPRLQDRPNFTIIISYSNNWREKIGNNDNNWFDWRDEMREWNASVRAKVA